MDRIKTLAHKHAERVTSFRRDLHKIPEPAYTEQKTSDYVAERLEEMGLSVTTGLAEYGVVGLFETGKPGKTLMIRADMDALPVTEETGLDFASEHDCAMHACGHDAHMAMALGAALAIPEIAGELCGNVKFVFQPAEEGPGGAKPMIEQGVMDDPQVDYSLGCHVWPAVPEGYLGVKAGRLMAAMDRFDITIKGQGCHGAMPHLGVDALEVGTQVVSALQRVVSRQMNPLSPTVVTVGSFTAGSTFNVIPGEATMCGTTRTFDREVWESWDKRLDNLVGGICRAFGADYELKFQPGYPPLVNDPDMAALAAQAAAETVGQENVIEPEPTMGGEDMAFYLEKSKGCFVFVGCGTPGCASLHNPKFDFNEKILASGVEYYIRMAHKLLG
jgi:amidohydrolase